MKSARFLPWVLATSTAVAAVGAACKPAGVSSGSGAGGSASTQSNQATGTMSTTGTQTTSAQTGTTGATTTATGTSATTGTATTTTATGTTTSGSTGSGPIDFGTGWQPPVLQMQPPLVGTGGTTVVIGPGADASSPGKFGGPNSGQAPTIVYPPSGVILPPNTNTIEFHFIPAAGQTLFRFTFHAPTNNLVVYTGCTPLNGGCVFTPDNSFWNDVVAYSRGTQPVTYTVTGVNGSSPGSTGTTAQSTIAFANEDVVGGLYYWNTSGIIQRYDYGFPNAAPQTYMTPQTVGAFACVGCHVLSRQGDRIAVGQDIPSPAPFKVYQTLTKTPFQVGGMPVGGQSNFFSFSPDEKYLLASDGVAVRWLDIATNTTQATPVVPSGTMPDWAPDGQHVVYAKPQSPAVFAVPGVSSASIESLHFNGVTWDTPTTLVPFAGQNNYYPAYSPTGKWVVFNRSPSNAESFSNAAPDPMQGTVPDGELWAVSSSGGPAIRLSQADNPGACSWPKWAPVVEDYYDGKLMWITFSSARAYGLRLSAGQRTQLWMAAFDPAKAGTGADASYPAFWLPFQDISGGNHIAQWTTVVPRKTCNVPADCDPGEHCVNGHCGPN